MEINNILKEFISDCSKYLNLEGVAEFGSSVYDINPHDIDLAFFLKTNILKTRDIFIILDLIKKYEEKYKEVVFDFSGFDRRKKADYQITIILISKLELKFPEDIHDLFLYMNLKSNKNKKILFGKDPLKDMNFNLTKKQKFIIIGLHIKFCLRKSLDDENFRLEGAYHLFKTVLRLMLTDFGNPKKTELISLFNKEYGNKIKLPKESERILSHDLKSKDFEDILIFTESCLKYLSK